MTYKLTKLVQIQSDKHDSIRFQHISFPAREGGTREILAIAVHDADSLKSFAFDNVHEAITFLTRALNEARNYLEDTP